MTERTISDQLYHEFERRLANIPAAANCRTNRDARGLVIEAARSMIDVQEDPGNRGQLIDAFNATIGNAKGDSWCMAFVQSCIAYVERCLGVVSPLPADGACVAVWSQADPGLRVREIPLPGAVVVWQDIDDPAHGHTGFVTACDGVSMHTIEGNTTVPDDLHDNVESDGDGVFARQRRWDLFNPTPNGKMLLGALKPFAVTHA